MSTRPVCHCRAAHRPKLVVVTGGPGAGKTAVLEIVQRHFCEHVVVLPESASVLFGGGFPRVDSDIGRRAAQRAIFRVQRELEGIALSNPQAAVVLCDRGTLDGLAYWPGAPDDFFADLGTTRAAEFERYSAVIHLRTPTAEDGYDHTNPLRTESAKQALDIDQRIEAAWNGHPARTLVDSAHDFMTKAAHALRIIESWIPRCCTKSH